MDEHCFEVFMNNSTVAPCVSRDKLFCGTLVGCDSYRRAAAPVVLDHDRSAPNELRKGLQDEFNCGRGEEVAVREAEGSGNSKQ